MPIKHRNRSNGRRQISQLAAHTLLISSLFFAHASLAAEKSFCFAMAESYYEQLYCEIRAKGEGSNLPAFYQFKNNNEQTQALLLKRPAAKIGVEVKAPTLNSSAKKSNHSLKPKKAPSATNSTNTAQRPTTEPVPSTKNTIANLANAQGCRLNSQEILCGSQRYRLLTNLHNKHLSDSALAPTSKMALPRFTGNMQNEEQVRDYLYLAYEQYLNQMRSIGLAGVTTRFGKFSYLFYDYHDKGLDFANRFETLFHYLKKDKAALGVSEQPADSQGMTLAQCAWLSSQYYVCEHGNNNLVYAIQ
ncbi:hypothetical protein QWY82_16285 [Simiduia curdlanivorans]|uniref:Uncharacterized protein n=1 Tax=Simiduia curdlanivorans TaxID=1492769 RepID=A0ABV8V0Q2_9GAMM|nr:hypothetical protein [Simiduia curdlanivorans]MDN3640354.1 hypothetical protein [Simiduia curdlanivorans]